MRSLEPSISRRFALAGIPPHAQRVTVHEKTRAEGKTEAEEMQEEKKRRRKRCSVAAACRVTEEAVIASARTRVCVSRLCALHAEKFLKDAQFSNEIEQSRNVRVRSY